MALDPRTPVIVGAGQLSRRPEADLAGLPGPAEWMAEVLRLAEADSGGTGLLERADSVQAVDPMSWQEGDPAACVARLVGATPAETVRSTTGGNSPQSLVSQAALDIQAGRHDVVLIAGVEVMFSRNRARRWGEQVPWPADPDTEPTRIVGDDRNGSSQLEAARGLLLPIHVYPLFENALWAASGRSIAEHLRYLGELWSRFSEVAARNPHAWSPVARTPGEIVTPSPDNRMVGFPYTKLMNANLTVDMTAALIVCSAGAAEAAGVPRDRWVFPIAGADAHDHWFVSERLDLHSSPAMAANGRAVFELAGAGIDDVAHLDLYSCFPSAVQLGADALGIDPLGDRPLTVTGGLGFGGGPGNNYVTHSIATMVDCLRADAGALGLITGLGWYSTKHAAALYSSEPPASGRFAWQSCQAEVDALPSRQVIAQPEEPGTIESFSVAHDRGGAPASASVTLLLAGGERTIATTTDAAVMAALESGELTGTTASVTAEGHLAAAG